MKERKFSKTESEYWSLWFRYIELLQEKKEMEDSRGISRFDLWDNNPVIAEKKKERNEKILKIDEELRKVKEKIKEIENKFKKSKRLPRLMQVRKKYSLNRTELTVLVILLMNELEDRGFSGKRGSSILSLLFPDKVERMKKIPLLSPEGKLIKSGLINYEAYRMSPLHVDYYLTEKALSELIGYDENLFEHEVLFSKLSDDEGISPDKLVKIIKPRFKITDIVFPEDQLKLLLNILSQVGKEDIIFKKWGFGKIIHYGRGLVFLFYGPPGTGKTMMAEAVAEYLKRDLAIVRYDQVENCFVGVTEKNIVTLFEETSSKNCVLLFDEADALFSYRSQRDMKYDNRVVNILLSEIEKYEGVVILTTNYEPVLDPALDRRVALKLKFNPPNREQRLKIWNKLIPPKAPLAPDVDFDKLSQFELTGAEIKNVVLNAARKAAARMKEKKDSELIYMEDFLSAIEIELKAKRKNKLIGFNKPLRE